jgi:hypothetical protein
MLSYPGIYVKNVRFSYGTIVKYYKFDHNSTEMGDEVN